MKHNFIVAIKHKGRNSVATLYVFRTAKARKDFIKIIEQENYKWIIAKAGK